jgi:threonine/homoserine/homoserine lactone efflux protein
MQPLQGSLTRIKVLSRHAGYARQTQRGPMSTTELLLAILALLLTPGPTNTLLLLAGAERGLAAAARLIPAELAGYLASVLPLALAGQSVLAAWPGLRLAVALTAAVWVALLALRLWHLPVAQAAAATGAGQVFLTTIMNPKALIFGLVLLPGPTGLWLNLPLFAGLVIAAALFWAALGSGLRARSSDQPRALFLLRRLASVTLAAMSVLLAVRGAGA